MKNGKNAFWSFLDHKKTNLDYRPGNFFYRPGNSFPGTPFSKVSRAVRVSRAVTQLFGPKTISNLPKRLFQVFRLTPLEIPFSNLVLIEKAQNLRDKIWVLVSENRNSSSEHARFCFWRDFRSVALQKKKFDTDCDPLSRRNLTISLQIALIWADFELS